MPDLGICSELGFLVNKCRMWEIFYWPSHRCSLQCKATERRPQPLALKPPSCAVSKRPRRSFWKWRPRLEFYVRKRVKLKIFLPTFLKNVPNARVKRSSAWSESCWSELIQGEVLPMAMLECEIMVHVTHKSEDLFDIARILSRNTSTRNIEHHIFKPFPRIHILLEFEYVSCRVRSKRFPFIHFIIFYQTVSQDRFHVSSLTTCKLWAAAAHCVDLLELLLDPVYHRED